MRVVDAYCGAGGWSAGAIAAGCTPIVGIDSDAVPLKLWATNCSPAGRAVCATIGADAVDWPDAAADVHVHLSPPCTSLSKARAGSASASSVATALDAVRWCVQLVLDKGYASWSLENVATPAVVRLVDADCLALAANKRHRGPSADGPRGVTRTKVELRGTAPKERWSEIVDGWRLDRRSGDGVRVAFDDAAGSIERRSPRRSPATTRSVAETALARPDVSVREDRRIKDVLLLRGMSRTATGATLAHEYGHCYLFARAFPSLPLKTEEGLCELFAWLWLGGGLSVPAATRATLNGTDEAENARRRARMEKRRDPVYGDGFRDAKKALERCGGNLWTLLEHVRANAALPTEPISSARS